MKLICIWWTRAHLLTTEQTGGAVRAINDRPYEIVGKLSLTNTIPCRWHVAATSANTGGYQYSCEARMQIDPGHRHHVGASFVSLAPTFFKSQSALTPLLLLFSRDPLTLGSRLMMRMVR